MDEVRVSVVVPAYNAEEWIGGALGSVLDSCFADGLLEIVVVDDGSEDHTLVEAKRILTGGRVRWRVQSSPRGGPARARNLGASMARGEWLQFLDADDMLAKTKLAHQAVLARKAAANVAVIYSPWSRVSTEGSIQELRRPNVDRDPVFQLLESNNFIATGSQLMNRTWFDRVGGFDERLWLVEDVHLALRLALAGGKFVSAPSAVPLFFYRRHKDSLSEQDASRFAEGCVRNARLVEGHWRAERKVLSKEQKRLLLDIYGHALRVFFRRDRRKFEDLLAQVLAIDPAYAPSQPTRLRRLSRLIGYRRAEMVALLFRRAKRWAGGVRMLGRMGAG